MPWSPWSNPAELSSPLPNPRPIHSLIPIDRSRNATISGTNLVDSSGHLRRLTQSQPGLPWTPLLCWQLLGGDRVRPFWDGISLGIPLLLNPLQGILLGFVFTTHAFFASRLPRWIEAEPFSIRYACLIKRRFRPDRVLTRATTCRTLVPCCRTCH